MESASFISPAWSSSFSTKEFMSRQFQQDMKTLHSNGLSDIARRMRDLKKEHAYMKNTLTKFHVILDRIEDNEPKELGVTRWSEHRLM